MIALVCLLRLHDGVGAYDLEARDTRDEVRHVAVRRVQHDLLRRSGLHDAAVAHDGDPVTDTDRFVQIVGDEHGGPVHDRGELHELVLQLAAYEGIEGAERLVHQQDLGIDGERTRESDALLHAAREFVGELVPPTAKLDHGQHLLGRGSPLVLRNAPDLQGHGDVVEHGAVRHQRKVLKDHRNVLIAKLPELLRGEGRDVAAVDVDLARARLQKPVDVTDKGRLAAAGQPHDAENLSAPDVETDVGHADDAVVPLERLLFRDTVPPDVRQCFDLAFAEDFPDVPDRYRAVG